MVAEASASYIQVFCFLTSVEVSASDPSRTTPYPLPTYPHPIPSAASHIRMCTQLRLSRYQELSMRIPLALERNTFHCPSWEDTDTFPPPHHLLPFFFYFGFKEGTEST